MGSQEGRSDSISVLSPTSTVFSAGEAIITIGDESKGKGQDASTRKRWGRKFPLRFWRYTTPRVRRVRNHETTVRKLEACPKGYPLVAAFQSSEPAFSLYRGFGYLHSRVLLDLQCELAELEAELDEFDDTDNIPRNRIRLKSRSQDEHYAKQKASERSRRDVLAEIRKKLVEYGETDELLVKSRETSSFQRPSDRDYNSVRTWFNNEKPLTGNDSRSIKCKEDMLTLRQGREWAGFDGLIESSLRRFDCKLVRAIFQPRDLSQKTNDESIYYYSARRVETFVAIIITIVIFFLLVLPVVAMYKLTSVGDKASTFDAIGVLVVFTLLFSAAMSLLTKAKRHELFAASAAYCAVLVVFISNFSGPAV